MVGVTGGKDGCLPQLSSEMKQPSELGDAGGGGGAFPRIHMWLVVHIGGGEQEEVVSPCGLILLPQSPRRWLLRRELGRPLSYTRKPLGSWVSAENHRCQS